MGREDADGGRGVQAVAGGGAVRRRNAGRNQGRDHGQRRVRFAEGGVCASVHGEGEAKECGFGERAGIGGYDRFEGPPLDENSNALSKDCIKFMLSTLRSEP